MINFEALKLTREQLLDEIKGLDNKEFNQKFTLNEWSIAQVCQHLYLCEVLFAKSIKYGMKQVDSNNVVRQNIQVVVDERVKVESPEVARPKEDEYELSTILSGFSQSREQFFNILSKIEDHTILAKKVVNHPRFGDLALDQWVELLYIHERRHIEQIKGLKAKL